MKLDFSSQLLRVNEILKFIRVFDQIYKNEFKEYLFIYVNLPERIKSQRGS
ncbi:hypothetical protein [Campylobacter concisus]|uniref:Uncharacterized protein n=1 Tax=Campylobacter concisus TaxID=199 RepID=A0AAE7PAS2_9BACT|nr:hypothetical protein [Campylobacter concisus]QPH86899.1 hypothetical protein CVT17_07935 [Campylobacter concisus]